MAVQAVLKKMTGELGVKVIESYSHGYLSRCARESGGGGEPAEWQARLLIILFSRWTSLSVGRFTRNVAPFSTGSPLRSARSLTPFVRLRSLD